MFKYIAYGLYVGAAILLIYGIMLYMKLKKSEQFGVTGIAIASECKSFGIGMFKKYRAEIRYKIRGKKYKANVVTGFEQPLVKGAEVQIRYKEEKPSEVIVRGNELYRIVLVVAAVFVVVAGLITMLGARL